MTLALCLALIAILLQVVDGYTTYKALSTRTNVAEKNKAAAWLFAKFGMLPSIIGLKALASAFILFAGLASPELWWAIAIIVVFYSWVAHNNIKVLRKTS